MAGIFEGGESRFLGIKESRVDDERNTYVCDDSDVLAASDY
jgi:hypothetical protein